MSKELTIGVIGGSGLYNMQGLSNTHEVNLETPYGKTSDSIMLGELNGVRVAFLERHGKNHSLMTIEVPYLDNIFALKKLGFNYLLSVSAVGSLRKELRPQDMLTIDQYIDFTKNRTSTFFGGGLTGHVSMAKPTCENLSKILYASAKHILDNKKQNIHQGGTYLCMEGPQFSSLAESLLYKSLNVDVIGMTNMPEAKLAREAQIAYATLAMITDYDCWYEAEENVSASMALANLQACAENAQNIIAHFIKQVAKQKPSSLAHNALEMAVFSPYENLSNEKKALYDLLKMC